MRGRVRAQREPGDAAGAPSGAPRRATTFREGDVRHAIAFVPAVPPAPRVPAQPDGDERRRSGRARPARAGAGAGDGGAPRHRDRRRRSCGTRVGLRAREARPPRDDPRSRCPPRRRPRAHDALRRRPPWRIRRDAHSNPAPAHAALRERIRADAAQVRAVQSQGVLLHPRRAPSHRRRQRGRSPLRPRAERARQDPRRLVGGLGRQGARLAGRCRPRVAGQSGDHHAAPARIRPADAAAACARPRDCPTRRSSSWQ